MAQGAVFLYSYSGIFEFENRKCRTTKISHATPVPKKNCQKRHVSRNQPITTTQKQILIPKK